MYLEMKKIHPPCLVMRIPDESGQHSGGKKATVPMGKRPAFRRKRPVLNERIVAG